MKRHPIHRHLASDSPASRPCSLCRCTLKRRRKGSSTRSTNIYKKPDVCQAFRMTNRSWQAAFELSVPSAEGWALNGINSPSGGITTGGWAPHLHECPWCCHPPTIQLRIKGGPATTASQEKKKKHNASVWALQWIFYCLIRHTRTVDAPHTRSTVRLLKEEPCSPFVHATSPSRMAFFLSSALYLSFLSPPSAPSAVLMVFVLTKKWQCPPLFEEVTGLQSYIHGCSCACACRMCPPVEEIELEFLM